MGGGTVNLLKRTFERLLIHPAARRSRICDNRDMAATIMLDSNCMTATSR